MDRLKLPPRALQGLAVALALFSALAGIAVAEIVMRFTGQFVTAILILPVIAATWYGGLLVGALTIALGAVFAVLALSPTYSLAVASTDDGIRLLVSIGVSLLAMLAVGRVRTVERRFRAVVTLALEGIWTIDADGCTTYVNPRMAEMLGYTPAEMVGRRFSEFVPPRGKASAETGFQDLQHGVADRSESELVRKDGSQIWIHYASTPMRDGARFIGALAVVTDITERRRNEMTIRKQAEALERANRQKEDFLAMLSHELRNPLSTLITAAKLMDAKGDATFQRERAVITRQVEQIARLVEDISEVSRVIRGKLSIRPETVDVAQLVGLACEMVAPLFSDRQHTLDNDVPDGLVIEGDADRLRQVFVNLLTNAAKYTPPGGHIAVTGEADGEHVVIRVRDNGVGISSDFLPVLFEPFTQKRETLDRSEGGLGLGLTIVRAIVQAHGGTIEAQSAGVGRGTEFIVRLAVTLPVTAATMEPTEARANQPAHIAD